MDIRIQEVQRALLARALWPLRGKQPVRRISTDSRTLKEGDLFFALKGRRFDGHDFLKEAVQKGARHLVVSDPQCLLPEFRQKVNALCVSDTLAALGDLAKAYRQKFSLSVVAVTGSVGKTTVKELIAHFLSEHFNVLRNPGTENNLVGVPKTIFQITGSHPVLVLELGTNAPGEIARLSSIAAPTIGVVTKIGPSHLEGLKDLEGVRREKLGILPHLLPGGFLVLNGEDPMLQNVQNGSHRLLRAGFSPQNAELFAEKITCDETGARFLVNAQGTVFESPLLGRHQVLNVLLAMLAARALGVAWSSMRDSLRTFIPVQSRLSWKEMNGIYFLDDTYNANPASFWAALETLGEFPMNGRKIAVCGDMLELGQASWVWHRRLGAALADLGVDEVIAVGPLCRHLLDGAIERGLERKKIHHVETSDQAGALCRRIAAPGDRILVKGSRGMRMERVLECFITCSTP